MRFDNLQAWLDWQAGRSPKAVQLGLGRVREIWSRLGSPDLAAPIISIAGTNGKGSSAAFAEAILQAAGYRTACYSSPHLLRYNERIRLDAEPVGDDAICAAFDRIDRASGDLRPTYFEFGTLAALCLFAEARPDAVILEVGLGGRLDAVNLVDADLALITCIGLDHQDWLGDDLESIGREKAGILRSGRPAVFSGRQMPRSIREEAAHVGAHLLVAGEDFRVIHGTHAWDLSAGRLLRRALPLPRLRGTAQIDNAAGVLVALDCLSDQLPIDQQAVRSGLLNACLPGRFEVRPGRPTWVLDVAHNPQAATELAMQLDNLGGQGRRIALCGTLDDKDAAGIATALAQQFDAWCLVDLSDHPRGRSAQDLAERVRPMLGDLRVEVAAGVETSLQHLAETAAAGDTVVVFGSFLTVAAAIAWLDGAEC